MIIRIIPYLLYLWLVAMHQVFLKDLTSIFNISITLSVLLVLIVALYKSEVVSLWFGFIVGLVAFTGIPNMIGWNSLILVGIGLAGFHVREKLNLDSLLAKLLLIFGGTLIYNIFILLITRSDNFLSFLLVQAIGGAVYTTVIAWLFFLFKEGKITFHKFKSIF